MKRIILPSLCALLSLATLNSCQKEEQSSLDLTKQLAEELQTVVDYESAELAAPRVVVINKRFQDAGVRVFALNGTPLLDTVDQDSEYVAAMVALAKEIGRIRASKPVETFDGEIDRDALVKAVGNLQKEGLSEKESMKKGTAFFQDSIDKTHATIVEFPEYYGSDALSEALAYVADANAVGTFTMGDDVEEVPAKGVAPVSDEEDAEEPAADEEE